MCYKACIFYVKPDTDNMVVLEMVSANYLSMCNKSVINCIPPHVYNSHSGCKNGIKGQDQQQPQLKHST